MMVGGETVNKKKKSGMTKLRRNDLFFYIGIIAIPMIQFFLMKICVDINAILLAFQKIDGLTNKSVWTLSTMKEAFVNMTQDSMMLKRLWNSVRMFFVTQVTGILLSLLFSNYIYKKFAGWGAFRVILYLPSIVSGVVTTSVYRFFVDRAVPDLMMKLFGIEIEGLLSGPAFRYEAVVFYSVWVSFGSSVLLYSNRMSSIAVEVVEAASLDGASGFKEFRYITFPHLYPLFSTFVITSLVGIFTAQYNLFTFGTSVATTELQTIGYWLFMQTYEATRTSDAMFPLLSATGMLITIVIAPLTFLTKHFMEKYGPSED